MRDRIVHTICNFLLNHVATKEYRALIFVTSFLGKEALDKMAEQSTENAIPIEEAIERLPENRDA